MEKMYPPVVNSPKTELTELITDKQTEITVANASVLLQGEGIAVLGNGDAAETITYTSVEDNVLKGCVRGFEGVARAWPVGTRIARNFTAADWRAAINNIQALHEEASSESRKPITLQPGVQIVKSDKQAVFNLAGLTGKTVIDYEGQKGLFGVRNPYVIRYGENLLPNFYEWTLVDTKVTGPYAAAMTPTVANRVTFYEVATIPGKAYTLSSQHNGNIALSFLDSSGNVIGTPSYTTSQTVTGTAPANANRMRVSFSNLNAATGTFTISNPMLNIGNTAKPFKPREDSMLALQTDLYADPVTGANADTVFERDGQYFKAKKWQGLTLDGNRAWVQGEGGATTGVRQVKLAGAAAGAVAGSGIGVKFDGKLLPQGSTGNTADTNAVTAAGDIYFGIPIADSGWADSYGPTQDDIKAYFFGWKAYDANTITPAQAQAATTATWNGTGTKYWVQRVGAPNFTQSAPQQAYAGYTPYQLVYQLATPTVEPIVSEGQLAFNEGDNQVEVGTGIVLREGVKAARYEDNMWINGAIGGSTPLKKRPKSFLAFYKDGKRDNWRVLNHSSAPNIETYGLVQASTPLSNFSDVSSYSVTYMEMVSSPTVPFTGSYAANEKTLLTDLVDSVQQNTARVSVLENKKADKDNPAWLTPTLLNGWSSVIGGGGVPYAAGYYKDSSGVVHMRGWINAGATAQATAIFKLPPGYRPSQRSLFICYDSSLAGTNLKASAIVVNLDGTVSVDAVSGGNLSLYQISYLAEQ